MGVARAASRVSWAGGIYAWASVCPVGGGSLISEALAVMETLRKLCAGPDLEMRPVVLHWFLRDAADRELCEALVGSADWCRPAVCHFSVQPPLEGAHMAVEAWWVGGGDISVRRVSGWSVETAHAGLRWLHVAGLEGAEASAPVEQQTRHLFGQLAGELALADLEVTDLLRTWIQVPEILGTEGRGSRYLAMNRGRAAAFEGVWPGRGRLSGDAAAIRFPYPASTGIGAGPGGPVRLAAVALKGADGALERLALENPRQVPAYRYTAADGWPQPLFSRGMAVRGLGGLWVWVSGTASIVGEKVAHPGDVQAQAEETFDNIAALLDGENFARHGWPGVSAGLMDMVCARVYVKDAGMGEICRAVCERRLPPCPTVYVQTDICRPELLVEVEGLVFRRLSGPEGT